MRALVQVKDCRDCPFAHDYSGHGECWKECRHPESPKDVRNILWGCQEQFKEVPAWCPIQHDHIQEILRYVNTSMLPEVPETALSEWGKGQRAALIGVRAKIVKELGI